MAEHHSSESNSSDSDIEETDVIDPILVATNAGASLTVPQSASISRKRKIHVNQGKYKGRGSSLSAVKSLSTWDRLKEYPNQHFAVVSGTLRCNACSEMLSLKKSSLDKHVKSSKHTRGISRISKDKKESQSILQCLQRIDTQDHGSGSTLPQDMRLFRFEIVECLLSAAFLYQKLTFFVLS